MSALTVAYRDFRYVGVHDPVVDVATPAIFLQDLEKAGAQTNLCYRFNPVHWFGRQLPAAALAAVRLAGSWRIGGERLVLFVVSSLYSAASSALSRMSFETNRIVSMRPAIRVDSLSKSYRLGGGRTRTTDAARELGDKIRAGVWRGLKGIVSRLLGKGGAAGRMGRILGIERHLVRCATRRGDRIIGRNGAGKSTLLKFVASSRSRRRAGPKCATRWVVYWRSALASIRN